MESLNRKKKGSVIESMVMRGRSNEVSDFENNDNEDLNEESFDDDDENDVMGDITDHGESDSWRDNLETNQCDPCFVLKSNQSASRHCNQSLAEQEAYAASTALMGETVFDCPSSESFDVSQSRIVDDFRENNVPKEKNSSSDNQSISVGIMAQGLAWAKRQRERRQRLYLQNQAEMQLRKIQKAQEMDDQHETPRSLIDNPTFQNLMQINKSSSDGDVAPVSKVKSSMRKLFLKRSSDTLEDDPIDNKIVKSETGGYSVELPFVLDKEEDDASWVPPVRIQQNERDTNETTVPFILSMDEMQQIANHVLPRGIVYCPWHRLYSLARDGDSFEACLQLIGSEKQTLLVVRTKHNAIFGGFADSPWDQTFSQSGASYFGGPTACLFRFIINENFDKEQNNKIINNDNDNSQTSCNSSKEFIRKTIIKYYKWTGANRYVQLCDPTHKMIAFGGGGDDGAFGLCVEQDFQLGSTGSCATFNNEPLCDESYFEIVDMEVWGFLIGQF